MVGSVAPAISPTGYFCYGNIRLFRLLGWGFVVHLPCFMGYERAVRCRTGEWTMRQEMADGFRLPIPGMILIVHM